MIVGFFELKQARHCSWTTTRTVAHQPGSVGLHNTRTFDMFEHRSCRLFGLGGLSALMCTGLWHFDHHTVVQIVQKAFVGASFRHLWRFGVGGREVRERKREVYMRRMLGAPPKTRVPGYMQGKWNIVLG